MSRRSWAAVTDFKTRVLRLKPEVQILDSTKSIRHTKVEILHQKSCFLRKKETKFNANPWTAFSTELFRRCSWKFHVVLLNVSKRGRPYTFRTNYSVNSHAWFAFDTQTASLIQFCAASHAVLDFLNQERLALRFPNAKFHVLWETWTQDNNFLFFSSTLIQSFRIQLHKKIANIWRIERDGISEIKFESARLHVFIDVFVAVAVVVA